MADEGFRRAQWEGRYDAHIEPINRLVDELRARAWLPYVAPMYGGTQARLLSILRDPGPKTQDGKGSGFICMENDDSTAEAMSTLFSQAGVGPEDILPWNAYPWYINRAPRAAELDVGLEPLRRLIDLLPRLRVVMLHGRSAQDGWKRLVRRHPDLGERGLRVIETYHTSRQAFWHADPAVREARKQHLRASFGEAKRVLAG